MNHYILTMQQQEGRPCYGIAALHEDGSIEHIDDVMPTLAQTAALADRLARCGVSELHFRDVVLDHIL